MTLKIYDLAPDRHARATAGSRRFHKWLAESWGALFSHPKDFTPAACQPGEDVIIVPAISDGEAKACFPDGRSAPKPHLPIIPRPCW